jgi:hypothetical protein
VGRGEVGGWPGLECSNLGSRDGDGVKTGVVKGDRYYAKHGQGLYG